MTLDQLPPAKDHRGRHLGRHLGRRRWLCRSSAAARIWAFLEANTGEWWSVDALAVVLPDLAPETVHRAAYRLAERRLIAHEPAEGLTVFSVPLREIGHARRSLWEAGLRLCPAPSCPCGFPTETGARIHAGRWCAAPKVAPW